MNRSKAQKRHRVKRNSLIIVKIDSCVYFESSKTVPVIQMLMGMRLPLVGCPEHIAHIAYTWERPVSELGPQHKNRFDSFCKLDAQTGCLLWTGPVDKRKGYGIFSFGSSGITRAHRAAWELKYGKIPDGLHVCHKCDIRLCVNIGHLFLGTQADNNLDKILKGRQPHGSDIWTSKLTRDQVLMIRAKLACGESQTKIARDFDVAPSNISVISSGKSWKWLQ